MDRLLDISRKVCLKVIETFVCIYSYLEDQRNAKLFRELKRQLVIRRKMNTNIIKDGNVYYIWYYCIDSCNHVHYLLCTKGKGPLTDISL